MSAKRSKAVHAEESTPASRLRETLAEPIPPPMPAAAGLRPAVAPTTAAASKKRMDAMTAAGPKLRESLTTACGKQATPELVPRLYNCAVQVFVFYNPDDFPSPKRVHEAFELFAVSVLELRQSFSGAAAKRAMGSDRADVQIALLMLEAIVQKRRTWLPKIKRGPSGMEDGLLILNGLVTAELSAAGIPVERKAGSVWWNVMRAIMRWGEPALARQHPTPLSRNLDRAQKQNDPFEKMLRSLIVRLAKPSRKPRNRSG